MVRAQKRKKEAKDSTGAKNNGANLGFEAKLWATADKLRGNMEASDYKHVVLGLIFLKYISDAFEAKRGALLKEELADAEDPEEYLASNVFWVPKEARWSHLQANAKQPTIGKLIDNAMLAIEGKNESLKGVLPKDYARPALNKIMLGELIDLISSIAMPSCCCKSRRSWRIWACTVTSRAVVGSSAMRTDGLCSRARAIITLCFIPPLSSCG